MQNINKYIKQMERQQKMLGGLDTSRLADSFSTTQKMLGGLDTSRIADSFSTIQKMLGGLDTSRLADIFSTTQKMLRKVLSSSNMNAIIVDNSQVEKGLTVLDHFYDSANLDLRLNEFSTTSNSENQEVIDWLNDCMGSCLMLIQRFKNAYNTLTNNTAVLQLVALIGFISSVITILRLYRGMTLKFISIITMKK